MKQRTIVLPLPKLIIAVLALSLLPIQGSASELRQQIIAGFAQDAKLKNSGFTDFSIERGRTLFLSKPATGKPDTPSCTTCHTSNPAAKGQTRAGKEIAPMAVSKTPARFADSKKVEKWFRRNCKSVLGRICTALEKGDFVTFMSNQ